jgi:hypothetical protein
MLTQNTKETEIKQNRFNGVYDTWAEAINQKYTGPQKKIINIKSQILPTTVPTTPQGIISYREATAKEDKVTCLGYALSKTTNMPYLLNFPQKLIGLYYATADIYRAKFFKKTDTPEKNDLVIYKSNTDSSLVVHYAVVIDKNIFESKFGSYKLIAQHNPYAVPRSYISTIFNPNTNKYIERENTISYWTLKEEFKTDQGKDILYKTIQHDTIEEDMDYFKKNYELPTQRRFNFMLMATVMVFTISAAAFSK